MIIRDRNPGATCRHHLTLEVIQLSGYTLREKLEIARRYLLPEQLGEHALTAAGVQVLDEALRVAIEEYTREAGVRNLEREIGNICRKVARKVVKEGAEVSVAVTEQNVPDYLGVIKFRDMMAHGR